MPTRWHDTNWVVLCNELMLSLSQNAKRKRILTKQGHTIEYDEMKALHSKPIIDEIDRVLATHYGFTAEELDFIINYDIKYRMGQENGNGDSGDGGDEEYASGMDGHDTN